VGRLGPMARCQATAGRSSVHCEAELLQRRLASATRAAENRPWQRLARERASGESAAATATARRAATASVTAIGRVLPETVATGARTSQHNDPGDLARLRKKTRPDRLGGIEILFANQDDT
jgi:hypothetical protein